MSRLKRVRRVWRVPGLAAAGSLLPASCFLPRSGGTKASHTWPR